MSAEMALINLAFAQAEITASGIRSNSIMTALEHIQKATLNLKTLAPDFDYPFEIDESKLGDAETG